ncbi:TLC ATP/ADP transporter-domain-containing protein [Ochromonadaceae sp. CCMP2298]|nr:TLC ATP/ADP transporter-domain-containing protein [Ochromonadaceae sp. CCMP2298]KAJ1432494.1 TLC ATP/ADP transporter-domain-containing protein [Ochromonadaceae sp. CCMP2298]
MGTQTPASRASAFIDKMTRRITGDLEGEDLMRVVWLSTTLFFIVGGYWLLRSLKDPIMSAINGVEYIPQAKIASLFVVFALVIVYNKMLDMYPKHHVFYMMGGVYGVLFALMGLLLMHPTIGLANEAAHPTRFLGWLSYVTIESFGSMVVQCFWALVNSSVDVTFAKKNFGLIVAGAQIGSILGPTLATHAETIGITPLYMLGSVVMFLMVSAMYFYIQRFGPPEEPAEVEKTDKPKKSEGVMEGFYLFWEHDYVKGIFAVSSLYMVQVTVIDYMMKVLAKERYALLYPDDPQLALRAFASFMGYFGQTTNSISFLFSLFGTGAVIQRFGLTATLVAFPSLMLACTLGVWLLPNIWVVFVVMMVIKGMSYALLNPTKEILYQMTGNNIKFKCKSWIDTFGQRGSKAAGSLITNAFASSMADLVK